MNDNQQKSKNPTETPDKPTKRPISRGEAIRAQKRNADDANRIASQYLDADGTLQSQQNVRANFIDDSPRLKIIGLGGMDGGGSKNTILVEYKDDVVIMDCGSDLGVDLPGINYGVADMRDRKSVV